MKTSSPVVIAAFLAAWLAAALSGCGESKPADAARGRADGADAAQVDGAGMDAARVDADLESDWRRENEQRKALDQRLQASLTQPAFREAVRLVERVTAARSEPLELEDGVCSGVQFRVPSARAEDLVGRLQSQMQGKPCYLFRLENNYGIAGAADRLALVPTADVYEVILLVGTDANGMVYGGKMLTTGGIIAWLKKHAKQHPLRITGVGIDFIEGTYLRPVTDPVDVARAMYKFCPDIVDQGTGTVEQLAEELKKGHFFLWWD